MPERAFPTEVWTNDEWFQDLDSTQRYLYIYLGNNDHCNQAGVYQITLTTLSNETKLSRENLMEVLPTLAPRVRWYPDTNYVWVTDFIKRQAKNPKFLVAAAKCLKSVQNNGFIEEILRFNEEMYRISIPYEYPIDRVSIPPDTATVSDSGTDPDSKERGLGVDKGEGESSEVTIPPSESEIEESLSERDRKVILVWRSVKGFSMPDEAVAELVAKLRTEFPDIDILAQSKAWAARKLSEPLGSRSRPSSQLWHWMENARKFARERGNNGKGKGKRVTGERPASDFRGGKW